MSRMLSFARTSSILLLSVSLTAGAAFAADDAVQTFASGDAMTFSTQAAHDGAVLRVGTPDGDVVEIAVGAGELVDFPAFRADGSVWPDGIYTWELTAAPALDRGQRQELEDARAAGVKPADVPSGIVSSGSFSIFAGDFVSADVVEESGAADKVGQADPFEGLPTKMQVFTTDLIVQGSQCLGVDCSTSESFGFDTLKLKENNLRIQFEDTSASANFPGNDWELNANESDNGGAERFALIDTTNNKTPFYVEANSPNNTLYLDSNGRVGVQTANPAVLLHTKDGNTPTLRLEQDGSDGFQSRVWDVAGNETNFFVRDVNDSSALPFRIFPGTGNDVLVLDSQGQVGMGTDNAEAELHVKRSTSAAATMLLLENNNAVRFDLKNTSGTSGGDNQWFFQADNDAEGALNISKSGTGGIELEVNERLDAAGSGTVPTLEVYGSIRATNVTFSSSRHLKTDFSMVDGEEVLAKLAEIPIQTWRYKTENEDVTHMGPIAEDFAEAFDLGHTAEHITVTDINGVALAAIQGLQQQVQELKAELAALRAEAAE